VTGYKRLERGRFKRPVVPAGETRVQLEADQLTLLLEGIDLRGVKRPKRWEPAPSGSDDKGIDNASPL
jgi:transposase